MAKPDFFLKTGGLPPAQIISSRLPQDLKDETKTKRVAKPDFFLTKREVSLTPDHVQPSPSKSMGRNLEKTTDASKMLKDKAEI